MRPVLTSLPILVLIALSACSTSEGADETPGGSRSRDAAQTSSPGDTPATARTGAPTAPERPFAQRRWRSTEVHPASEPVFVGDALVLYTHRDGKLSLTALDPETGTILWSRPAATSQTVQGVAISPQVVGDAVAHLAPATASTGSGYGSPAVAVLRDARSGEPLITAADAGSHQAYPRACESDEEAVCVTIFFDEGPATVGLDEQGAIYDAGEEDVTGWSGIGPLGMSRETGRHIGRAVEAEIAWDVDTTDVFGGDSSTNTGWIFDAYADESLLIGSVGPADGPPAAGATVDMTDRSTVALDAATGETTWSRAGMDYFCDPDLPAQTESQDPPLILCQWTSGTLTVQDETFVLDAGNVNIARLDPESGQTLWTVPAGTPGKGEIQPVVEPMDDMHLLVITEESELVIDVTAGDSRKRTGADVVWLEQPEAIPIIEPGSDPAAEDSVRPQGLYLPTLIDSRRSQDVPWPIPSFVGAALDDPNAEEVDLEADRAVADPDGVSMYAAP